jgi:hypothetical protein
MGQKELNCWEHKNCGRQLGGRNVDELGVCPAAMDASFDGINCGVNAGGICWAVAGTCCGGKIQGTFAEKRLSCINCDFYNLVQEEEGTSESASAVYLPAPPEFHLTNQGHPGCQSLIHTALEFGDHFTAFEMKSNRYGRSPEKEDFSLWKISPI